MVIAESGVWLIDAKNDGGKVEGRDVGGSFNVDYRLFVGGRDRTRLIEGLEWQVKAVESALGEAELPVRAALCFTDATWKRFAKPSQIGNVSLTRADALPQLIAGPGPLDKSGVIEVAVKLAETFSPRDASTDFKGVLSQSRRTF
jgi:hypothetical protein